MSTLVRFTDQARRTAVYVDPAIVCAIHASGLPGCAVILIREDGEAVRVLAHVLGDPDDVARELRLAPALPAPVEAEGP